jgi:hypothetical protein
MRNKSNSRWSFKPCLSRLKGGSQMLPALRNVHSVITGCPINYRGQFVSTIRYTVVVPGSRFVFRMSGPRIPSPSSDRTIIVQFEVCCVLTLPDNRHLPLTVTILSRACAIGCVGYFNTWSGTTGSNKLYLSHKINTLYNLCTRKYVAKRPEPKTYPFRATVSATIGTNLLTSACCHWCQPLTSDMKNLPTNDPIMSDGKERVLTSFRLPRF